jgi:hypothetical protein
MPQFDQFSFLTQISWFLLLFFIFYFLFIYFYLPNICYNIKFRKKKIKINKKKQQQILFEKINMIILKDNINKNFFLNFYKILNGKKNIYIFNKNKDKKNIFEKILKNNIELLLNMNFLICKKFFI